MWSRVAQQPVQTIVSEIKRSFNGVMDTIVSEIKRSCNGAMDTIVSEKIFKWGIPRVNLEVTRAKKLCKKLITIPRRKKKGRVVIEKH